MSWILVVWLFDHSKQVLEEILKIAHSSHGIPIRNTTMFSISSGFDLHKNSFIWRMVLCSSCTKLIGLTIEKFYNLEMPW